MAMTSLPSRLRMGPQERQLPAQAVNQNQCTPCCNSSQEEIPFRTVKRTKELAPCELPDHIWSYPLAAFVTEDVGFANGAVFDPETIAEMTSNLTRLERALREVT